MAANQVTNLNKPKPTIDDITHIQNSKNNNTQAYTDHTSSLTNGKPAYITHTSSSTNDRQDGVTATSSSTNGAREYITDASLTANDETELQRFYGGASVLITGATGFMGKVLVEKLLRSCPGIRNIYLVVRRKKGKSVEERIDELTSSPCFDRLKEELPKFKAKLVAITGDLSGARLGVSNADQLLLGDDVNVVFHVAATVRFDENIKTAIEQNVKGTKELLNLCATFKKLKSVVHVSTAYANCPRKDIGERFYDPPIECDEAIRLAETLSGENYTEEALKIETAKLLGSWPNTYAFTKAISENVVKKHAQSMPVGVFRPAIVICTKEEPIAGWIDNLYGPTGVLVGVASGLLRTMCLDKDIGANVVPCDMVINAMIATAWDVHTNWKTQNSSPPEPAKETPPPPVYNYVTSETNIMRWEDYVHTYIRNGVRYPVSRSLWYYSMTMVKNRSAYLVLRFLLHIIPALIMDAGLSLTGNKTQMLRIYEKIHKFSDVITYFGINTWHFEDANVYRLWDRLDARDRRLFPFDMRALCWQEFIADTCVGLRRYIMNDPPSTLPQAKIRLQRLYVMHRATQCLLVCLAGWLIWAVVNSVLPASTSILPSGIFESFPMTTRST